MSRGPKLEQIENHDYPTMRVVADRKDGTTEVIEELLESSEALALYRKVWAERKDELESIRVVNERTGTTRDMISRG